MLVAGATVPRWFVIGAVIALAAAALVAVGLRLPARNGGRSASQAVGHAGSRSRAEHVRFHRCHLVRCAGFWTGRSSRDAVCARSGVDAGSRATRERRGIGAAQVAFVAVFAPYASEARLFAFHILWQLSASV